MVQNPLAAQNLVTTLHLETPVREIKLNCQSLQKRRARLNQNMVSKIGEKLSENELCPPDLLTGQEEAFENDIQTLLLTRIREFVQVNCPACDSSDAPSIFTKYELQFVRCATCFTIFMNPRPSEAVLADYYKCSKSYRYWAEKIFPASEQARKSKIHEPWYAQVKKYCRNNELSMNTLLEVGAGFGTFCSVAKEAGDFRKIIAIEPTPSLANHCRSRGLEVLEMRIENVPEGTIEADIAVSFEVIEHTFEPRLFLKAISSCLKPGGLVVLSCPNGEGFDIVMLGNNSPAVDAEHMNLFNPGSLKLLLNDCGFEVLEVTTPGRLDAEFVREAALAGTLDLSTDPFLKRTLIEEWDRLGWPFQTFLAENGLSSHMWILAQRIEI